MALCQILVTAFEDSCDIPNRFARVCAHHTDAAGHRCPSRPHLVADQARNRLSSPCVADWSVCGSSDRSGGIALTMSLCLASSTFVTCSRRIKDITMRPARIYHWRRMHRFRAPSRPSVKCWPCRSWAGSTTNMFERKFPTGTMGRALRSGCGQWEFGIAQYRRDRWQNGHVEPNQRGHLWASTDALLTKAA